MSQNRSSAVMQQRSEAHDSLDDFPTPPYATRALCEWLRNQGGRILYDKTCREPAANRGFMVAPLTEYFRSVDAADINDYGVGLPVRDYLFGEMPEPVHWTITNPPFRLAEQFIARALATSTSGIAMLVRSAYLESEGRYESLFSVNPPSHVLIFVDRVVMLKGRLVQSGAIDPFADKPGTKASTATSYAWLVWMKNRPWVPTELHWLKPRRRQLERPGDYPTYDTETTAGAAPLFDGDGN